GREEARISVETEETGVVIKADTLGGLEALAFELGKLEIPICSATIGTVNKKDLLTAENADEPLEKIILGFATKAQNEVAKELDSEKCDVKYISGDVIYHIIEKFEEWREERQRQLENEKRESVVYPGRILLMRDHIFRRSGPVVAGIRVLGGRIHVGQTLIKPDGTRVGQVKSIRVGESGQQEAVQGDEVAVAISGATIGRGLEEEDVLLVDIPESHAKKLQGFDLSAVEQDIFDEIVKLHRKTDRFWGY
ncbi:MAG TPA: translation initiation factor IF-2, partial [Candidatus Poseidoniales archaeon]|nr:translation initiation factor IF-2 [Candidatus Poseidoniales archaeon]